MNVQSALDPRKFLPALAGIWMFMTVGYRLRPDNGHQYFLLSQSIPDRFPPLPWLGTPLHGWFLCPSFINPLWFLALMQGLCCVLTGWAALRLIKAMGVQPLLAMVAIGAWLALGHCGHDSSMSFIKGYVTPASVAGTALLWGTAFFLEGRTVPTLMAMFLASVTHLGFAPVALLMCAARLGLDTRNNASMKASFPLCIIMAIGISAMGIDGWEAYMLDRSPFRSDLETVEALLGTGTGLKFLCELAMLGLVAVRQPFQWASLPALLFFISLSGLCIPGAWPLLRATPLAEIVFLGILAGLGPRRHSQALAMAMLLGLALWQAGTGRLKALQGVSLDTSPPQASAGMLAFIQAHTPPDSTIVIPPHFTTFRSHARRKPYVDIAAIPWTMAERSFWLERLQKVYGEGIMKPEALYAASWHEILHRAWNTGAGYLLWPTSLTPPGFNLAAVAHQDTTWTLVDLSKVTP